MKTNMNEIMKDLERSAESNLEALTDYNQGIMDDIFSEIADGQTSIYYSDIAEFLKENVDEVTNYINEFGWDGDLYKAAQGAEYMKIYNDYMNEQGEALTYWAASYIADNYGNEIDEDAWNAVADFIEYTDINRLEEVQDGIDELFTEAEEENAIA